MTKNNNDTGVTIVNALKEPHSTRLNRLMNDIGLITSLISGLMSRYNRMKKSLKDVSLPNQKEVCDFSKKLLIQFLINNINYILQNTLETEMTRLTEKLEDAKALKMDIDSRKTKLLPILHSELNGVTTQSFNQFMSTKIRLIIHMRDIKDRIDIVKKLKSALNQEKSCLV